MKRSPAPSPSVVVYVNERSYRQDGIVQPDICADYGPVLVPQAQATYDPQKVHREFPERWRSYIRANFRNLRQIQEVFGVSERTARKWWDGETGANGGHVAIAVIEHPVEAPLMLFAAE